MLPIQLQRIFVSLTLLLLRSCSMATAGDCQSSDVLWRRPIIGAGATSGSDYVPTRIREFQRSSQKSYTHSQARTDVRSRIGSRKCDRWIVTTTISKPTENLNSLANMAGWCLCIVLDMKSPSDFSIRNAVVLTVKQQRQLPYRVMPLTPWNHFGRKNVGFIYAMHHGAKMIYDTDDDNFLDLNELLPHNLTSLKIKFRAPRSPRVHTGGYDNISSSYSTFNPYPLFGMHWGWPRGYPLPTIITERLTYAPQLQQGLAEDVCVLQSLANSDPDVDAVFRLTRDLPEYFDQHVGEKLLYPAGVFVPFNAQATVMTADVFCSMMLPVTVHGRVSDIWRSYFMQHEMWGRGCHVAFSSPLVSQYRNAHKYLNDFQSELDLYLKVGGLLDILNSTPMRYDSCFDRVMDIYITMYEYGIVEENDVLLAQAFTQDVHDALTSAKMLDLAVSRTPKVAAAPPQPPQPPSPSPRAAICITGTFRFGSRPIQHWKNNLFPWLDIPYDIYLISTTGSIDEKNPNHHHFDDFAYLLSSIANLTAVHRPYDLSLYNDPVWNQPYLVFTNDTSPSWGSQKRYLIQLNDLQACWEAVSESAETYTHIIKQRADSYLLAPIPFSLTSPPIGSLSIPDSDHFGGTNDRFAFGDVQAMQVYLNVLPELPRYLAANSLFDGVSHANKNAESILREHLRLHNISVNLIKNAKVAKSEDEPWEPSCPACPACTACAPCPTCHAFSACPNAVRWRIHAIALVAVGAATAVILGMVGLAGHRAALGTLGHLLHRWSGYRAVGGKLEEGARA